MGEETNKVDSDQEKTKRDRELTEHRQGERNVHLTPEPARVLGQKISDLEPNRNLVQEGHKKGHTGPDKA